MFSVAYESSKLLNCVRTKWLKEYCHEASYVTGYKLQASNATSYKH